MKSVALLVFSLSSCLAEVELRPPDFARHTNIPPAPNWLGPAIRVEGISSVEVYGINDFEKGISSLGSIKFDMPASDMALFSEVLSEARWTRRLEYRVRAYQTYLLMIVYENGGHVGLLSYAHYPTGLFDVVNVELDEDRRPTVNQSLALLVTKENEAEGSIRYPCIWLESWRGSPLSRRLYRALPELRIREPGVPARG